MANRCTPEVGDLLFDENEILACAAVRYLAFKGVVRQAPAILEAFKTRRGLVAHNCALTLGDLGYEPAWMPFEQKRSAIGPASRF